MTPAPRLVVAAVVALAPCLQGCAHRVPLPGNVRAGASSAWIHRQVGCVDLRIAAARDRLVPAVASAFAFDFRNTCGEEAVVDLTKVRVEARLDGGGTLALASFDPGLEMHPASLGAGDEGAEVVEYDPPGRAPLPPEARAVCIDVGRLSPSKVAPPPACFLREGDALVAAETAAALPPGSVRSLPEREVSLVVGYRHFSRFGDGWEQAPLLRVRSAYAPNATAALFRSYPIPPALGLDSRTGGTRRVGCLDVHVETVRAIARDASVVLALDVGNRCASAVRVAFANASVSRIGPGGVQEALALYDPASELPAAILDGRGTATERLQYVAPGGALVGASPPVCVDVSRLVDGELHPEVAPVCLSKPGGDAAEDSVIGHQAFGAEVWRRPWHVTMELGAAMSFVELRTASLAGTSPGGKAFNLTASPYKRTMTFGLDMHVYPWWSGPLYAGFLLRGQAGPVDPNARFEAAGTLVGGDSAVGDVSGAAVAGVVFARSTAVRARADLALGVRAILADAFPPGCSTDLCEWDAADVRPLVAPRIAADAWFSPWWSVTAWADADVLYLPDFSLGLSITFHSWAYDAVP